MHTKEPWPEYIDVAIVMTPNPDGPDAAVLSFDDYKRARACVDACAGFANPEKDIPAIETGSKMHFDQAMANGQRASEYEAQRDELLSIVKDMRNAKSEVFSMSPEGRKYLAKMDAAIAKCEY